ncbi:hypothetical protein CRYUN_Cryun07bG0051100 [Craigia yunnanensis]
MGIGMVLAIVTMLISAIVEDRRRAFALSKPIGIDSRRGAISSLSTMWLIPQLTLIGLSEAFTIIALIEFYCKQFPENMRSIAGSFTFIGLALSNYLSSLLISVVHKITKGAPTGDWLPEDLNKGKLDYFYYLVAALEVLNLGYFIIIKTNVSEVTVQDSSKMDISGLNLSCSSEKKIEKSITLQLRTPKSISSLLILELYSLFNSIFNIPIIHIPHNLNDI